LFKHVYIIINQAMINILLAEDHNIVRNGIRSVLEREDNIHVTGEAVNGADALALLAEGCEVDLLVADMNMPVMGGVELTEQIKEKYPKVKIIILSALDHEKYVIKAFQSGANAYLLKSAGADELVFAIRHVNNNNQYICSELTTHFLKRLLTIPDTVAAENINNIEFSNRELEVLILIADGFTNQEIADKLFTSRRTIEGHRQSLMDKTGSRNSAALVRFALINGVIS
jgi:DNA-binding NarL/FixJ family response regulator